MEVTLEDNLEPTKPPLTYVYESPMRLEVILSCHSKYTSINIYITQRRHISEHYKTLARPLHTLRIAFS